MDSLIAIEQTFQRLLHQLKHHKSHRIALTELIHFVKRVYHRHRPELFHSYFQQLFPLFSDHFETESVKFRPPDFYVLMLSYLEQIPKGRISVDYEQRFMSMQSQTRLHQSLNLIWLGEWKSALSLWQPHWTEENEKLLYAFPETPTAGHSLDSFEKWSKRLLDIHFPMPEIFFEIGKLWRNLAGIELTDAVWVPLIEKNSSESWDKSAATIEPMRLEIISSPGGYHRDFLTFNYSIDSSNDLMYQQAFDALYSMKNLLKRRFAGQGIDDERFRFHFLFPKNDYRYTGDSLGVAMALLNLCKLTQSGNYRCVIHQKEPVVATGIVNSQGDIRPISNESLAAKLTVFYFSPFRYFLLPAENLYEAKLILDPLRRQFPGKSLVLLPLKTVDEVLRADNIIEIQERPVSFEKQISRILKYFWPALASLLAILLAYFTVIDHDSNPVSIKGYGNHLLAYNQKGKILWSEEFPVLMKFINEKSPDNRKNSYAIGDINGDGFNEIFFTIDKRKVNENDLITETYLLSHTGKVLWTYSGFTPGRYANGLHSDTYIGRFHIIHDFDKDGQNELACYYHNHPYFPSQLIQFDHKGQLLSIFYNSGYFYTYEIYDLDNDGIDELIMGGTNNDYDTAVLAVLKYPHFAGHSPQLDSNYLILRKDADYRPPYLYLRFPKLKGLPGQIRESILKVECINNGLLMLTINLAGTDSDAIIYMGKDFQVQNIVLADCFELYKDYYHTFDWDSFDMEGYLEKFSKVEFWNGEAFTDTFTVNTR